MGDFTEARVQEKLGSFTPLLVEAVQHFIRQLRKVLYFKTRNPSKIRTYLAKEAIKAGGELPGRECQERQRDVQWSGVPVPVALSHAGKFPTNSSLDLRDASDQSKEQLGSEQVLAFCCLSDVQMGYFQHFVRISAADQISFLERCFGLCFLITLSIRPCHLRGPWSPPSACHQ